MLLAATLMHALSTVYLRMLLATTLMHALSHTVYCMLLATTLMHALSHTAFLFVVVLFCCSKTFDAQQGSGIGYMNSAMLI